MNIKDLFKKGIKKGTFIAALITLGVGVPSSASTGVQHAPDYSNNKVVEKYTTNLKGVNNFVDLEKIEKTTKKIKSDTLPYVESLEIKINNYLEAVKEGKMTTKEARNMLQKDPNFQHVQKNLKLLIEIQHYLNEKTEQIVNYDLEHNENEEITEKKLAAIRQVKNKLKEIFYKNGEILQNLTEIAKDKLMREGTKYAIEIDGEYDYETYYNENDIKRLGL